MFKSWETNTNNTFESPDYCSTKRTMAADPIAIATRVIQLGETDDYLAIINLASSSEQNRLTSQSSPQQFRKNYLKLSLLIHPDRLSKAFPDATKAFQLLVKAFESLTAPELIAEIGSAHSGRKSSATAKKSTALARSNDGCYRTRVCCPRCKEPWNEGTLDGNPDYFYNFLMTGLKQYTCSTCLCEFGCMTAIHRCPHCNGQFEYMPSDYHRKLTCPHKKCGKEFGFYMYHASDRAIKEVKAAVKAEQERFQKAREAKLRRAKRAGAGEGDPTTQEAAFMMGLSDVCPRCGEDFTEVLDEEEQRRHLMECTDEGKHRAFESKKAKTTKKKADLEAKQEAQRAAQTQAAWQLLGANTSQLWLLDADQLRAQASQLELDVSGDKDTLIDRIVRHSGGVAECSVGQSKASESGRKRAAELIGNSAQEVNVETPAGKRQPHRTAGAEAALVVIAPGGGRSANHRRGKGSTEVVVSRDHSRATAAEALPSDLASYSAAQLRSMCAAQGLLGLLPKKAVKSDLIRILETQVFEIEDD